MKIHVKTNYLGLITLLLVVAKLTDTIACSWVWVFAPMWIPMAIVGTILAGVAFIAFASFLANILGSR